ncbi:hypothetical protein GIB67_014734 [Kingdonia uniflora]|uniref:Uncharacterized protein n=1 Tax=Kingdonia uniflora TaxID=39325 RepID=A0A7J7NUN6_9MAGN|nr:hypothetical protein GIB67_014734 [Kingdonia uniflora]
MVVVEIAKTDIVFFNQEEVVGEAYQASADQTTAIFVEEQTLEVKKTEDIASQEQTIEVARTEVVISHQKKDVGEASQTKESKEELVLMESEVDVTLKKWHALTRDEINERAVKMACEMNRLHAHLDGLSPEAKKDNSSTYMRICEEIDCLNTLHTLYPNQWLDNEVIDLYIQVLIQYFDTQHRARPDNEKILLADIFACQYIGRDFNIRTRNMSSP